MRRGRTIVWLWAAHACADDVSGLEGDGGSTSSSSSTITTDPTSSSTTTTTTGGNGSSSTSSDDGGDASTSTADASTSSTTRDGDTSTSVGGGGSGESSSDSTAIASSSGGDDRGNGGSSTSDTGNEQIVPAFVEVAAEVGIDHAADVLVAAGSCLIDSLDPPIAGLFCSPERFAGGAAVTDVDDDDDLDVYVTRPYSADLLYLPDGSGNFTDVAADVGLGDTGPTSGAAFGDVDGDGDQDLYVTTLGELRHWLFINMDGAFVEDGEARGAAIVTDDQHAGTTPVFGDYDLDGDLDIYVGEWRTHALGTDPSHARLLRNLGPDTPGMFEDVTIAAGLDIDQVYLDVASNIDGTFVLSAGWADMDGDDWPELLLACDFNTSRLFWNEHDGAFADGTIAAGVGTDENGMGAAVADYDADGDFDWFVTSINGGIKTGNRLYRYEGDRVFSDATDDAGVREGYWGWGASFFDHDLDGDVDIAATSGWFATGHLDDPMVAYVNDGTGVFTSAASELGFDDLEQGRALVTFDADGDGDLEVLIVEIAGGVKLYRNDRIDDGAHWLRVQAPGASSNTAGLGAIVTVTTDVGTQVHEIGGTSHYLGHGPREAHFGLGDDALVDVHVRWPATGIEEDLTDVAADQVLVVPEG